MSKLSKRLLEQLRSRAPLFAALGEPTRIGLLARLAAEGPGTVTRLSAEASQSRQAISKHLAVLAEAGLISGEKRGREQYWRLEPRRLSEAQASLEMISKQWDDALERLRHYVEH
jgi:DNA-binding transcriptional ArsR family regulator